MNVRLLETEKLSDNIISFHFAPEYPQNYTAGQYVELIIPHKNPDSRGIKRWFTLSSSPTEQNFTITTKFPDSKPSTYKKALSSLEKGDVVKMVDPMGDFVLPKDKNIILHFVAGGIGITPFRSMIKWLIDTKQKRNIRLIYAVKNYKQLVFIDEFKKYGDDIQVVKSSSTNLNNLTSPVISTYKTDDMIYISGPETMVEKLTNKLLELGIDKTRLVSDYFPGYTDI